MKIIAVLIFLIMTVLFLPFGDVVASDLRCGPKLVSIGDYKYDVFRKCGEPTHVESWEEVRFKRDLFILFRASPEVEALRRSPFAQELVTVEEWEYNFGQSSFIRYLRFENGRLTRIVTGDYGY